MHSDLGQHQGHGYLDGNGLTLAGRMFKPSGPSGLPSVPRAHYVSQQSPRSPVANCVGIDESVPTAPPEAPWRTKPRAQVFDVDNSQGIGVDPYVPTPTGTASWYPDSGASNHVCQSAADLNASTLYSGTSELLMGNGAPTRILSFTRDNNVFFEFHPSYYVVKDIQTGETLLRGRVRDGLYQFSVDSSFSSSPVSAVHNVDLQASSPCADKFTLWHNRLCHPSSLVVNVVLNKCGIVTSKKSLSNGPASVACDRYLYYVLFKMVATQFEKTIKKFQSDLGGEFRVFASIFADHSIIHRLSCPHTSEQNGVAERKHRHIVETGLTLLPTLVLQGQSPYQKLYGCAPTYDHLWVFGCCCFLYLRPFQLHKLDFRSQACTFLGYSSQHKGYYCLTPEGSVIISRHVVFNENRFLFSLPTMSEADCSLFSVTYVPLVRPSSICRDSSRVPVDSLMTSCPFSGSSCEVFAREVVRAESDRPSDTPSTTCCLPAGVSDASPTSVPDASQSGSRESSSSAPTSSEVLLPVPCGNTHAMVPRSKAGIFKPNVLSVETVEFEPCSVDEAIAHPEWKLAFQVEYDALMANSTWELLSLPPGRKAIGYKWLFKIKREPDGSVDHRKARLAAKGCAQQPPGFVQFGTDGKPLVYWLQKALYGLRQASRAWFNKLKQFLSSVGFTVSRSDASLFVQITSSTTLYVLVYVDDIIITCNDSTAITSFIEQLYAMFSLKNMGNLYYFLGVEVMRSSSGSVNLCQRKYIQDLLARSSLLNAKPVHTPMISSTQLSKDDVDRLGDPTEYRSLAGALQYVVLMHPDISYAVNRICQFMHSPTTTHMVALKRILRYLCGTLNYGLVIRPSSHLPLVGYADTNWGLDFDDYRSISGFFEAKYRGLAVATSDVTCSSAFAVAANPVLHSKFKHVELDLFLVREKVSSGALLVSEVLACDQVANVFTKPLSVTNFTRFRTSLRVLPVEKMDA
ncbi:hypothetical protein CXB51_014365 [Gossypium anomalum]|uniref:Integrase catalytic domain-containing protein n=1 Tax=Gossypium anomalum TaxID=47600 RepID=A0A8J5Z4G4_9ROSI|nr:hypothetical protein CXB51_014365 [Gossypium anomalum]